MRKLSDFFGGGAEALLKGPTESLVFDTSGEFVVPSFGLLVITAVGGGAGAGTGSTGSGDRAGGDTIIEFSGHSITLKGGRAYYNADAGTPSGAVVFSAGFPFDTSFISATERIGGSFELVSDGQSTNGMRGRYGGGGSAATSSVGSPYYTGGVWGGSGVDRSTYPYVQGGGNVFNYRVEARGGDILAITIGAGGQPSTSNQGRGGDGHALIDYYAL